MRISNDFISVPQGGYFDKFLYGIAALPLIILLSNMWGSETLTLLHWLLLLFFSAVLALILGGQKQFEAKPAEGIFRNALAVGKWRFGKWKRLSNYRFAAIQKYKQVARRIAPGDWTQAAWSYWETQTEPFCGINLYPKKHKEKEALLEGDTNTLYLVARAFLLPNNVPFYNGGPKEHCRIRLKPLP